MRNAKDEAAAIISAAEAETGLSDWGGDEFREPLCHLLDGIEREARLSVPGQKMVFSRINAMLRNRLRLAEARRRDPRIEAQEIRRPIFILGLPRAGTTLTHALFSCDPANRSPRLWEILDPVPAASCGELDGGSRCAEVQSSLDRIGFSSPMLSKLHQTDASSAEECGFIFEYSAASRNFAAFWRLPAYAGYLATLDYRPVYATHKRFLQHAQSGCAGERWVLKAPMHIYFIEALLAVYPDAVIVQNHRDPARIIPSTANFMVKLRELFSDDVDPYEAAAYNLHAWHKGLETVTKLRRKPEYAGRFHDVHYTDLARQPVGTLERLYRDIGIPMSGRTLAAMTACAAKSGEGHQGGGYTLTSFGIDAAAIDEIYGGYMREYGVQKENRL